MSGVGCKGRCVGCRVGLDEWGQRGALQIRVNEWTEERAEMINVNSGK